MARPRRIQTTNIVPTPVEPLLNIEGLCAFLKLGKTKVFELIHNEGLPYHPFGRAYRFDKAEVWQWLQTRRKLA